MKITKEILESTVQEIAKVVLPSIVDEDFNIDEKAPYELYNAIVGTVFDEEAYNKVATEAPEYLYSHIPGGSKMTSDSKSADITGDDKIDEADVTAIEELLDKENPTMDDIKKGDVTGDFKLDKHDKDLIEKEAARQKKSEVEVEEDNESEEDNEPEEVESNNYEYIYDEASWNASFANGGLKKYYAANPDEDRWNVTENRAGNFNDKVYELEIGNGVYEFAAHWETDDVQKITNVNDNTEVYYLDMFYSLDENEHELFTDVALTESANKTARFRKVKWSDETCPHCWQGAINAPGAKYPWIVVNFEEDVNATIKFQYEGKDDVTPWNTTVFGKGEGHKEWGAASVPVEFGDEFLMDAEGVTTFDISKFKMILVKQ